MSYGKECNSFICLFLAISVASTDAKIVNFHTVACFLWLDLLKVIETSVQTWKQKIKFCSVLFFHLLHAFWKMVLPTCLLAPSMRSISSLFFTMLWGFCKFQEQNIVITILDKKCSNLPFLIIAIVPPSVTNILNVCPTKNIHILF